MNINIDFGCLNYFWVGVVPVKMSFNPANERGASREGEFYGKSRATNDDNIA